jgi:hypothetical protein
VAACRRLDEALRDVDGRLIAAGWRRVPPRRWVEDGHLDLFLAYWQRAAQRPSIIGSCYNRDPDDAADAWWIGVPASYVRAGLPLTHLRGARRLTRRARIRLARAGRAALRTSVSSRHPDARRWTVGALARIGRLSPEAQRAVAWATDRALPAGQVIRPRDIAWAAAAPIVRAIGASERARIAWAAGRRRAELAGYPPAVAELCPAYPGVPMQIAERIARGESPASVSGGMTRRDAHDWLCAGAPVPAQWLLQRYLPPQAAAEASGARSVAVAQWLIGLYRRGGWGQLTRDRRVQHDGREYTYRLAARLDELTPEHVAEGGSAEAVFRRVLDARLDDLATNHRVISCPRPEWPDMPPGIRLLTTPAQIVARGREHDHCVGGYVPRVAAGSRWIVSVETPAGDISTAEIDAGRGVRQHRGPRNSDPTPAAIELLRSWTSAPPRGQEEAA